MNIGVFTECYLPTRNGVVVSVESFRRKLSEWGHNVHVFAPRSWGYRDTAPLVHRFPSYRLPFFPDYPFVFPFSDPVRASFPSYEIDVIHAQSVFILSNMGAYLAGRYRIPLVLTFHTLLTEYLHYAPLPPQLARFLVIVLIRMYCHWCKLVIVPTGKIASVLRDFGVRSRIEVLSTGIDTVRLASGNGGLVRSQHRIPDDAKVLLYVGRLAREKNLDFLMWSVASLLSPNEDTYLLLVGSGPYASDARRVAQTAGIADRVRFVGSVPWEKVPDYYAAADLFIFASRTETQGMVLAEAMAAGLPCVAVDALGVSETLSNGVDGFLTPPETHAFVHRIDQLLTNTALRQQMSRQARHSAQRFSEEAAARRLVSLYQSALDE